MAEQQEQVSAEVEPQAQDVCEVPAPIVEEAQNEVSGAEVNEIEENVCSLDSKKKGNNGFYSNSKNGEKPDEGAQKEVSDDKPNDETEENVCTLNSTKKGNNGFYSNSKSSENPDEEAKSDDKVEPVEKSKAEAESKETNGKHSEEKVESTDKPEEPSKEAVAEAVAEDETCKRKAEVEEEKTPKKAKTVEEDGDQVAVEETAA